MPQLVHVANVNDIPPGTSKEVTAAGRVFALFNIEGEFYALDGLCLHAGGPIGEGRIQGCTVTCPWHGWQYDIPTGQHQLNHRLKQPTFSTHIEEDKVLIELPE